MPHQLTTSGTLLHVGCGSDRIENTPFGRLDWQEIRFDISPTFSPDVIGNILAMDTIDTGSVDGVYSSHNLEHLEAHQVPIALGEFLRVLRPGGLAVIRCPDLEAIAQQILVKGLTATAYESPSGPISALDMVYGHRPSLAAGDGFMAHRCGFTQAVLETTLELAGFAQVSALRCPASFELWAIATREPWPEQALIEAGLFLLPVLPEL